MNLYIEKKNNGYEKLLEEIKKVKIDNKYKPKNYSFNLNSFKEDKNEKK